MFHVNHLARTMPDGFVTQADRADDAVRLDASGETRFDERS